MNSQTYYPNLCTHDDTAAYIYKRLIDSLIDSVCSSDPIRRYHLCSDAIELMLDIHDGNIMDNDKLKEYQEKLNSRFRKVFCTSPDEKGSQLTFSEVETFKVLKSDLINDNSINTCDLQDNLEYSNVTEDDDCICNITDPPTKCCENDIKSDENTNVGTNEIANEITTETDCNKNKHYVTTQGIQAIDLIDAYNLNFNLGNVIKYVSRCNYKDSKKDDLEKAMWYIDREMKTL